jgi:DNA-binding FrmR family transcriptional regulator
MYKPKTNHEKVIHRLKISLGHLQKVINMAENHKYCIDIIHQSQAVQNALRETDNVILENHLKSCTAEAIRQGKGKKAVAEVMSIIQKSK